MIPARPDASRAAMARTSKCAVRARTPCARTHCRSVPRVRRRACGHRRDDDSGAGVLGRELYREPLPPFLAAATQNFPPPFRFHSRTKTMFANTAGVARTVCGLTHEFFSERSGDGPGGVGRARYESHGAPIRRQLNNSLLRYVMPMLSVKHRGILDSAACGARPTICRNVRTLVCTHMCHGPVCD
jgi:hypothetical protein